MENVYIDTMRIGAKQLGRENEGLTFEQIRNQLLTMGHKDLDDGSTLKLSVFRWWLHCSTTREINEDNTNFDYLLNQDTNVVWDQRSTLPMHLNVKLRYLKPEAYLELVHYESLQEARESSRKSIELSDKSIKLARNSLIIATLTLIITAFLAITSIFMSLL